MSREGPRGGEGRKRGRKELGAHKGELNGEGYKRAGKGMFRMEAWGQTDSQSQEATNKKGYH